MPEGEAIHRTAAALRTALVGRAVLSFEAPHLNWSGPRSVESSNSSRVHGKQLDIVWDDGLTLHTNLLLSGVWHLYRTGERWRKPSSQLRVGITVDGFAAVCFGARTVETYREFDTHRHPGYGRTGPDLCDASADLDAAVEALVQYDDLDAPIAEALLDQQVASGVGNVFRSEILWASKQHPFAPVSMLARPDMERIITVATRVLQTHLNPQTAADPSCRRAVSPSTVETDSAVRGAATRSRSGVSANTLDCCTGARAARSTVAHEQIPRRRAAPDGPASSSGKFLAELPWNRRGDLAG